MKRRSRQRDESDDSVPLRAVAEDVESGSRESPSESRPALSSAVRDRVLWGLSAGIFVLVTGLVAATANDLGLTWDEPPYITSQRMMGRWFAKVTACRSVREVTPLFSKKEILGDERRPFSGWVYNRFGWNFHPPLAGMLSNLTHLAFGSVLGELGSRRLASGAEFGVAAAVLFLFLARRYSVWVGGVAAGSLVLMPRVFGDAHIAGTDLPLMAFWAFAALAFWNGLESRGWRVGFGVLLGLSLLVKFTALLVVVPLVVWLICYRLPRNLNARSMTAAIVGTAVVGWPLAVAGVEIVRLAGAIRHNTQQEVMLRPIVEQGVARKLIDQGWPEFVGHAPPFREAELKDAAIRLLGIVAKQEGTSLEAAIGHGAPYSPREIQKAAERLGPAQLALDSYIAYVQPVRGLGVTSFVPGWILFLPLACWLGWCGAAGLRIAPVWLRETGSGLRLWLAGLAIAPAVALALNPTWWHETLPQLAHYYQISVGRQGALPDIEIFYLGKKYVYSLPWHNAWVLIAVTVPTAILAAALVGLGAALQNWRRDPLRMFFLLNMITLPASRMLPTPAHDGVRLMLPTFFFLAGLAGWGFEIIERLVERFKAEEHPTAPVLAIAAGFLLLPPAGWLYRAHPFELSYYNGFAGGLAGAQRKGFEPTYWYDAVTPDVLADMNDPQRGLPRDATLSLPEPRSILAATLPPEFDRSALALSLPEQRINPEVFVELRNELRTLRGDVRLLNPVATDFPFVALLTHSSKASPFSRLLYAVKPKAAWSHDGVRLFSLYDPRGVSRTWALWILLDATDYSRATTEPQIDDELLKLAKSNYVALYAAALLVSESGLDEAMANAADEETKAVIERLARKRPLVEILLARRKEALTEAVEIIRDATGKRPGLLELLVQGYDGYLPASRLGEYLDAGLVEPAP